MLNPDGVRRGHYRTDIFGVNLNRTYKDPDIFRQPSIFAVKTLMMYQHFNRTDPELCTNKDIYKSVSEQDIKSNNKDENDNFFVRKSKTDSYLPANINMQYNASLDGELFSSCETINDSSEKDAATTTTTKTEGFSKQEQKHPKIQTDEELHDTENGIYIYIDLHGHASKRGCFIYGNHFPKETDMVECMLLPKLISINSSHFDFQACNFTEKNMYHMDKKDGLSKDGSGRVSMFKALGIIHRYFTLLLTDFVQL